MDMPLAANVLDVGVEIITMTSSQGDRLGALLQLTHRDTQGRVSASSFQLSVQSLQALHAFSQEALVTILGGTSGLPPERRR